MSNLLPEEYKAHCVAKNSVFMFISAFKIYSGNAVKSAMLNKIISAVSEDLNFNSEMQQEASCTELRLHALKNTSPSWLI